MERGSTKHGARMDDAMDAETEDLQRTGHSGRAQEWMEAEPAGEDQPLPDLIPDGGAARGTGTEHGLGHDEAEARAELARHLRKSIWPAPGHILAEVAEEENAPSNVLSALQSLPEYRLYDNVQDVWRDLGGKVEERF